MRIAAIDQGTTSTRVLVADESGAAAIGASFRHRQHHPAPGRVEHDGEELLGHVRAAIAAAGPVSAIGIDNQGESCLAWDAISGEALSPVIVWQDKRTEGAIGRLAATGAEAVTLDRAGLPLDPYFSAAKLRWLLDEVPAVAAAHRAGRLRLGTTDAFFLDRLTGHFVTDTTTASRTCLMNLETGAWDADLCALFGVPIGCLPEIRPTVGDFGRFGGVPITAGVVDQQAALFGHGCRVAGDAKITFGTGAFALCVTGGEIVRAPERGLLPTVAWNVAGVRTHAVDGGVYDAGSAIEWAQRIGLVDDLAELGRFDGPAAIDRGLAFVPALSGLACPHWDRSAGALFIGMSGGTTRADLQQALLEGIALRTGEVIAAMDGLVSLSDSLSIDGGLTRSDYFCGFLADCLGRELRVPAFDEATALGTAQLAALGVGGELPPARAGRVVAPRPVDRAGRAARFAAAVERARGWAG